MSIQQKTRLRSIAALTSVLINGGVALGLALPIVVPAASAQMAYRQQQQQYITLSDHLLALRRAIIGQESGANFRAVNPHSGALGYGQVMPANVPSWSRQALGYSISTSDFLNNPEIQLRVIDFKLGEYWRDAWYASGGDVATAVRQVAARWYSGNPYNYASNRPQYYEGHRYPSIAEYSYSILQKYKTQVSYILMAQQS